MRKAINENRTVQLALIGVLALAGGLMLMKMGGGGAASTAAPATATTPSADAGATSTTPTTDPGATATTATTTDPSMSTGAAPATPVSASTVPPPVVAPKLPARFVSAYDRGDTVVLLLVRGTGAEDRLLQPAVRSLGSEPGVTAFVVPVEKAARYAAVTQSVKVERVPALVVVRPQKLTKGAPQASVSYGFRNRESIVQAVRDAQYKGPVSSYSPD
jgi:hypothetical protein